MDAGLAFVASGAGLGVGDADDGDAELVGAGEHLVAVDHDDIAGGDGQATGACSARFSTVWMPTVGTSLHGRVRRRHPCRASIPWRGRVG